MPVVFPLPLGRIGSLAKGDLLFFAFNEPIPFSQRRLFKLYKVGNTHQKPQRPHVPDYFFGTI